MFIMSMKLIYCIFNTIRIIHEHIESLKISFSIRVVEIIYKKTNSRFYL